MKAIVAPGSSGAAHQKRQQVHPFLRHETYRRLKTYCARRGVSQTAVVEGAVRQYLDDSAEGTLIMRRLDRAGRRLDRVRRELVLLSEFVSVWARLWFAHTPQLPENVRVAAQATAANRYQQLLEFVAKRVSGGQRLVIDLLGEDPGDEEELRSVGKKGPDGPAAE